MLEKQKVRNTKTNIGSDMNLLMMEAAIKNEQLENINECGDIERSHGLLSRTISVPQSHTQQDSNVTQLVTTIIENLGNMNLHRKLERTQSEPLPQQANTSRYKTELCRPFEEAGECKYGEKCQFAHGFQELRNLQRHPKYKTEYCRTFHSVGFCPYGPRCHFVHNQDEARAMQQMQTKIQNHSNSNNTSYQNSSQVTSTFALGSSSPKHVTAIGAQLINHSLPLSPPLSMSTGSDRESPTGSLSISPTNSVTNFPFVDQISPTNSIFHTAFSYVNTTPPDSPNAPISPVNTPPPNLVLGGLQGKTPVVAINNTSLYVTPIINASQLCGSVNGGGKRALKKSCSSPVTILHSTSSASNNNVGATTGGTETDARLPVFNRFSLSDDFFPSNVAT